jgi:purine nucleosidase
MEMNTVRVLLAGGGFLWVALLLSPVLLAAPSAEKKRLPVLLDTDIGSDVDDAFALALVLASPELELLGVTTVSGDTQARARIACRLLMEAGRRDVPVSAGAAPQPPQDIGGQLRYQQDAGVDFERIAKPVREPAVTFLYNQLRARPGEVTLLTIGPLTNAARLLREHPDCKPWIKRIVLMAGSVRVGYKDAPPPEVEWNVKCDIPAAQAVFASGLPLVVAPLDATTSLKLEEPLRRRLFAARTPLTGQVQALYRLWGQPTPTLFDPVAVALCFDERFCKMEELRLEVDDKGLTRIAEGKPNARVATAIQRAEFLEWYVKRVASF